MDTVNRFDIINMIISARRYSSFLEIGTYKGETFRAVSCAHKVTVDPDPDTNPTFCMTSDDFFHFHDDTFDIIFIDGLHEHGQAYRDILNALNHLNHDGTIVVHDCFPTSYSMQMRAVWKPCPIWTGDVWKAFVKARSVLPHESFTVLTDMGCGIIDTSRPKSLDTSRLPADMNAMKYSDFDKHRDWVAPVNMSLFQSYLQNATKMPF